MKKKWLCFLLALGFVFALGGCSCDGETKDDDGVKTEQPNGDNNTQTPDDDGDEVTGEGELGEDEVLGDDGVGTIPEQW